MSSFIVRSAARAGLASLAALALAAAPAAAQLGGRGGAPRVDVTPYAGIISMGNYLDGPLGTSLKTNAAPVAGAQLSVKMIPGISLVGNVAYSSADLKIGVPILGGVHVGSSKSWLYDAGVELRAPSASIGFSPFLQAGAGVISTQLSNSLIDTKTTNKAFNAGVGLDLGLGRGLGARVMVKDYVGRFQTDKAGVDIKGDVSHNVAGSVGLRLSF